MEIKTIVNEPQRGCGFRKAGGLYLIAGAPSAPCGKLPLALEVCPTCGQGVKPARGWTWVDAEKLFIDVPCEFAMAPAPGNPDCGLCPLCRRNLQEHPRMGLLWVGEQFYATPEDFLKEGEAQGISRRIQAVPKDFELGKTWVLFAHRKGLAQYCAHPNNNGEAEGCPDCEKGIHYAPGIFSCFLPERIEYVVKADDPAEKLEQMEKRGISLVQLARTDGADANGELDLEEEPVEEVMV